MGSFSRWLYLERMVATFAASADFPRVKTPASISANVLWCICGARRSWATRHQVSGAVEMCFRVVGSRGLSHTVQGNPLFKWRGLWGTFLLHHRFVGST